MTETYGYDKTPTPPRDYDASKVPAEIKKRATWVKTKFTGEDVAEAYGQAMEITGIYSDEAKQIAQQTKVRQDNLETKTAQSVAQMEADKNTIVANATVDSEVILARGGKATLGQRLDETTAQLADDGYKTLIDLILNDESLNTNSATAEPFVSALKSVANKVPSENFNIGFITDNHYEPTNYAPNALSHYKYIGNVSNLCNLKAVVAGGDNINGNTNRNGLINDTRKFVSTLMSNVKGGVDVFALKGNHDVGTGQAKNNGTLSDTITNSELSKLYGAGIHNEKRNEDVLYFYKDYAEHKIRLIGLDSFDTPLIEDDGKLRHNTIDVGGFRSDQLNWLANEALVLPDSEYEVIIFSHAPITGSFATIIQHNSEALISILNGYQNGSNVQYTGTVKDFESVVSKDFTTQGASKIIAFISGHVHSDGNMIYQGINCIQTEASLCYVGDAHRVKDTLSEDAWDIVSVNKREKVIKMVRFGYGTDRSISY